MTTNNLLKKAPIVSLQGQPVLLFNNAKHSLLDALEIKKVKVFSECRNGFCGCCKTKIRSGSVTYFQQPVIAVADDECLPCCCVPESNLDLELSAKGADVHVNPTRYDDLLSNNLELTD